MELNNRDDQEAYWPIAMAIAYTEWSYASPLQRFIIQNVHLLWSDYFFEDWKSAPLGRKGHMIKHMWMILENWVEERSSRYRRCMKIISRKQESPRWSERPDQWRYLSYILPWTLMIKNLAYLDNKTPLVAKENLIIRFLDNLALNIFRSKQEKDLSDISLATPLGMFCLSFDVETSTDRQKKEIEIVSKRYALLESFWVDFGTYVVKHPRCPTTLNVSDPNPAEWDLQIIPTKILVEIAQCMKNMMTYVPHMGKPSTRYMHLMQTLENPDQVSLEVENEG